MHNMGRIKLDLLRRNVAQFSFVERRIDDDDQFSSVERSRIPIDDDDDDGIRLPCVCVCAFPDRTVTRDPNVCRLLNVTGSDLP